MDGKKVKDVLRRNGVSQKRCAELLGMSCSNLSNLLSKEDLRSSLIEKIVKVTGIPLSEFVGDIYIVGDNNFSANNSDFGVYVNAFLAEISKQRQLSEKSQKQIDSLIAIIAKYLNIDDIPLPGR